MKVSNYYKPIDMPMALLRELLTNSEDGDTSTEIRSAICAYEERQEQLTMRLIEALGFQKAASSLRNLPTGAHNLDTWPTESMAILRISEFMTEGLGLPESD